jgi:hypothetical protein
MQATQQLPPSYAQSGKLDLSNNRMAVVGLNLLLLVVLAVLTVGVLFFVRGVRGGDGVGFGSSGIVISLTLFALYILMILLHEAIHGVCFWWYTRARPYFGVSWRYAYAAAPGWYIPRNDYFVVALAPAVVITVVGLLLIAVVPPAFVAPLAFVVVVNGAGAVGDYTVVVWLLRKTPQTLVQDVGDTMTLYAPNT